jgi:peptidoglycan/xylan/chitin deacetylase (PgdA/CDA1 family)
MPRRDRVPPVFLFRFVAVVALVVIGSAVVLIARGAPGRSTAAARTRSGPVARARRHTRLHTPGAHHTWAARHAAQTRALRRALRRTSYVSVGSRRRKDVALTFDDGPGPSTRPILRLLHRLHVPATFFVVGRAVAQDPAAVREEQRLGFAIGNHTQDHAFMAGLTPDQQAAEITGADAALRGAGVASAPIFRPPYGSFSASTLAVLHRMRMLMVLWTIDTKDFARPGTKRIVYTALSGARGGALILMHDGGPDRSETIAALPRIVHRLRQRRFHLVTVPQLVRDDPPPADQPAPKSLSGR